MTDERHILTEPLLTGIVTATQKRNKKNGLHGDMKTISSSAPLISLALVSIDTNKPKQLTQNANHAQALP
jgi:hypothetical protein